MHSWLVVVLFIPWALLGGCGDGASTSVTDVGWGGTIRTVPHDGHTFVTMSNGKGVGIVHHPGCECLTKGGRP